MDIKHYFAAACLAVLFSSCAVIRQGEVGVKRKVGKLQPTVYQPGAVTFNPFTSTVIKVSTQTDNIEVNLDLPSKEGLTIKSQISILYHVKPEMVPNILQNIGTDYERTVILAVFRSAASDVTARFMAKEMHTSQRSVIEAEIKEVMQKQLQHRGFEVEAVLLKSIVLPAGLSTAIQQRMEAEQQAQQMEFILQRERQEAERKIIEAQGLRDAQKIISEGLNEFFIKWKSLEVFKELSQSPNTKVIITDGKTPLLIDPSSGQVNKK
ncbi:MAG TPA: prohibitin family protein [Lacibacter sp.]|nr:prohibitin family protein [Lacibacter sp.]HMO89031.1 prohibitin family protein [Lacibacter sp.]HMP88378.1 prohibitin family protein [Lacibacter sp.]